MFYSLETPSGFYPMMGLGTPWLTTPNWDILCWMGWFRQYRPCRRRLQVTVSFSYTNCHRKREPTTFHGNENLIYSGSTSLPFQFENKLVVPVHVALDVGHHRRGINMLSMAS